MSSRISVLYAHPKSSQTKDAAVLPTGLLRLSLRAAGAQTTSPNCKYRTAGVREYWIVDPDKNRILVYNFASEDAGDYTFSETVKAGIYEDLEIDFNTIEL